jgi:ferredoxin-type protein NapG
VSKENQTGDNPTAPARAGDRRHLKARREFLRTALGCGIGAAAMGVLGYIPVHARWEPRLRPPGSLLEDEFLSACIKCGQCVQVCPVEAIRLADMVDGFGVGTPFIQAREQACDFSCDGLQCVLACPTGALTHEINYPHQVSIGAARLDRPDLCLAMQGKGFKGQARGADFEGMLRYDEVDRWNPIPVREHPYDLAVCDLCARQCPIEIRIAQCEAGSPPSGDPNQCPPRHAITLELIDGGDGVRMKPVIHDGCVGCGACEMICPVEPAAIVVEIGQKAFVP